MQEVAGGLAIFGAGYPTNGKMQVAAKMRYQMGSTGMHVGIQYKKIEPLPPCHHAPEWTAILRGSSSSEGSVAVKMMSC